MAAAAAVALAFPLLLALPPLPQLRLHQAPLLAVQHPLLAVPHPQGQKLPLLVVQHPLLAGLAGPPPQGQK